MSVITQLGWKKGEPGSALLTREWLLTNGLGGYASGSLAGVCTRRFHGLLIAALPAPLGRIMMLNHLAEEVHTSAGAVLSLSGEERVGSGSSLDVESLREFRLEDGLPVWVFSQGPLTIEKRIVVPHLQNTSIVTYRVLASDGEVELRLRPAMQFRAHEGFLGEPIRQGYAVKVEGPRCEIRGEGTYPPLRMLLAERKSEMVLDGGSVKQLLYRVEQMRGYDWEGPLWSPGFYRMNLAAGEHASLLSSTESWEAIVALTSGEAHAAETERRARLLCAAHPKARSGIGAQLVLAADQFVIIPQSRVADAARAHACGDDARTVIAGYHWFTDWGRDTMISLEGLTLETGRHDEAGYILRTFARYVKEGLIPNMFPEGEKDGLYHTADATLWFFHAVDRYVAATGDHAMRSLLLPTLIEILERHQAGTRFGIHVDAGDGLLTQGEAGYQLTWMDAKVGDWVVTPRRGKAVEINALFYNALRLVEGWVREERGEEAALPFKTRAERAHASFNARFWNPTTGHLFDVVDGEGGDDAALRPNQIFAVSLTHPVLDPARWASVVHAVRDKLATPVGLRSLSPDHPDYKPTYDGDLNARDAAYHQGTVWGWLIGALVDAWLRVHPGDRAGARVLLSGIAPHLGEACIGTMSEIFDAAPPFTPRGCVAQAWSVAEALRALIKTAD